jgi:hypothetical protein
MGSLELMMGEGHGGIMDYGMACCTPKQCGIGIVYLHTIERFRLQISVSVQTSWHFTVVFRLLSGAASDRASVLAQTRQLLWPRV